MRRAQTISGQSEHQTSSEAIISINLYRHRRESGLQIINITKEVHATSLLTHLGAKKPAKRLNNYLRDAEACYCGTRMDRYGPYGTVWTRERTVPVSASVCNINKNMCYISVTCKM